MKRIFSFVLSALLAVVFTTAHAQQNIFIWKGANIAVKSAANTDSITTSAGSWLFNISTYAAYVTTNTLISSTRVSFADNVQSLSQTPEVGVCFSSEKATPTYADERKRLGTLVGYYDFTLYDLDPGTTYYYCAYVKLGDEVFYGNVESIMTFGEKPTPYTYKIINGRKFIDLGLPSGLLWARSNVGATFYVDDGDYFAWGETEPKSSYDSSTYKWGNRHWGYGYMTKYNSTDKKTTLDPEDDAATVNWGAPCRMPSSSECQELCDKCDWAWQSSYKGKRGYLVTGPNGNTIFFPVSYWHEDGPYIHGYWSRSLDVKDQQAYKLDVWNEHSICSYYRDFGLPVRPVAEK